MWSYLDIILFLLFDMLYVSEADIYLKFNNGNGLTYINNGAPIAGNLLVADRVRSVEIQQLLIHK